MKFEIIKGHLVPRKLFVGRDHIRPPVESDQKQPMARKTKASNIARRTHIYLVIGCTWRVNQTFQELCTDATEHHRHA